MSRLFKRLGIVLALVVTTFLCLLIFFSSQVGVRFILGQGQPILIKQGVVLQPEDFTGNLLNFTVQQVKVDQPELSVEIKNFQFAWNPLKLFAKTLSIDHILVDSLSVDFKKEPPKAEPSDSKSTGPLGIKVQLYQLAVKKIHLKGPGGGVANGFVQAKLLPNLEANWQLNVKALKLPLADMAIKKILTEGQAQGTLSQPLVNATLIVDDARIKETNIDYAAITSTGGKDRDKINLKVNMPMLDVIFDSEVVFKGEQIDLLSKKLSLKSPGIGHWQQTDPSLLTWHQNALQLSQFCLAHEKTKGKLCAKGQYSKASWQGELKSDGLSLSILNPLLNDLTLQGNINLNANVSKKQIKEASGQLALTLDDIVVAPKISLSPQLTELADQLAIRSVALNANLKSKTLRANLSANLFEKDMFKANAVLSPIVLDKTATIPDILANLNLNIHNLKPLSKLVSVLFDTKGSLTGQLTVKGKLNDPIYQGQIKLNNLSTLLIPLNMKVNEGSLAINVDNTPIFNVLGQMKIGQGQMKISGQIDADPKKWRTQLSLLGQQLHIMDQPWASVYANPNLRLEVAPNLVAVKGAIDIPSATIDGDSMISESTSQPDVVYLDKKGRVIDKKQPISVVTDLKITLGKAVKFSGLGAKASIQGNLALTSSQTESMRGTGVLVLKNGSYELYGKKFKIDRGRISFAASPLSNPGLDIIALYDLGPGASVVNATQIGLHITGTAVNPDLRLFSEPSMSEENIISTIIVGSTVDEASDASKSQMTKAALMMGVKGGSGSVLGGLTNNIGLSFGNLTRTSTADSTDQKDSTAVFVGRSITPRLYVGYGVGLFNDERQITARYKLSPKWEAIVENSSLETNGIILFRIEK